MLKYRKIYYAISGLLLIVSAVSLMVFGLKFGIDFTGGTILEVDFKNERPSHESIKEKLSPLNLGDIVIQASGDFGVILRLATLDVEDPENLQNNSTSTNIIDVDEAKHQEILSKLKELGDLEEKRFDSIGPTIGEETKRKSMWATLLVILGIMAYIAWAFKGVSFPLKSWKYGIVAIITLVHNIVITVGAFSIMGEFLNAEAGITFVAAILTILGYSINDTIVIFDRIRENVFREGSVLDFERVINKSISQAFVRSIATGLCTLFALLAIYLFGGETLKYFVLILMTGIVIGTYSSIFLASPLLFSWSMLRIKKNLRPLA